MKILLLGADGQLGLELRGGLACFADVVAAPRTSVDLADLDALRSAVRAHAPDLVVNAAAYNDVDGAERDPDAALRVNADAVALLGEEALARGIGLVTYSTDFVFDGRGERPYVETDVTNPLGAYARSKREGERRLEEMGAPALILRTAWVYSTRRKSFVSSILRAAREREVLKVVADQVGNPTFCRDLAQASALLLYGLRGDPFGGIDAARGIFHLAGTGHVSRYEFARAIVELDPRKSEHKVRSIEPVPTSAFPLPAERPLFAPLDCDKLRATFGVRMPGWRDALVRALAG